MNETDAQNSESKHYADDWKSWSPEFFLSELLHELRTPLIIIKAEAKILSDEKTKDLRPEALESISKAIEKIEKLCEGIVDYRRELEKKLDT